MKLKKILRILFATLFIIFMGYIVFRIAMMKDSRTLSDIYATDGAISAFAEDGDGAFLTHRTAEEISGDGYFAAYAMVYIPSSRELQITARYNDSVPNRYLLGSDPDNYAWELRDADGNVLARGKILDFREKYIYNYVKLSFENIDITDDTELRLFLISEDVNYPDDGTDGLLIHRAGTDFKEYKPDKTERTALIAGSN